MQSSCSSLLRRIVSSLVLCVVLILMNLTGGLAAQTTRDSAPQPNGDSKSDFDPTKVGSKSPWPELRNLRTRGDFATDEQEAREIDAIYKVARVAFAAVQPGPDAGAQRRAIKLQWADDMEVFLNAHTNSAWTPAIALAVGSVSHERLAYTKALGMYARAWDSAKNSSDARTRQMADEAGGGLAGLLAMTGQLELYDGLIEEATASLGGNNLRSWWWAREFAGGVPPRW